MCYQYKERINMCQTPEQCMTSLWERYRHPLVRDLAWLIAAPDLLETPTAARPGLPDLGLDDERLTPWLRALEQDPRALIAHVAGHRQGRLGHYHERLWQFMLAEAPGTRLLAHNLPIVEDKRTLGELDLLYFGNDSPHPIHLEVAIKFYLGLPEGPGEASSQARWVGPGCADSLAVKRQHLHRHQLPLSSTRQARRLLGEMLGKACDIEQRLALPGVLFYPWGHAMPAPQEATREHLRGEWLPWRQWPAFREQLPHAMRGSVLRKPHWLAPPPQTALRPLSDLEAQLAGHFSLPRSPLLLSLHAPDTGWRRVFLVGDDWPDRIPLPPSAAAHSF